LIVSVRIVNYSIEIDFDMLEHLEGTEDVAMPQIALHPFQLLIQILQRWCGGQAFGHLPHGGDAHGGDAHGNMEPVQHLLCLGTQVALQIAHGLTAIREKGDGLIHHERTLYILKQLDSHHFTHSHARLETEVETQGIVVKCTRKRPACVKPGWRP
jgi:hypothetical protein